MKNNTNNIRNNPNNKARRHSNKKNKESKEDKDVSSQVIEQPVAPPVIQSQCNPKNCYSSCKIEDCPISYYSADSELEEKKLNFEIQAEIEDTQSFVFVDFKGHRREIFLNDNNLELNVGEKVVVSAETGYDMGKIAFIKVTNAEIISKLYNKIVTQTVVRKTTADDLKTEELNQQEELEILNRSNIITQSFGLDMKVIDTEWQFDRHKITIFFTAPSRVDFRELVKDLARQFKARIELRQINTREEVKRIGDGLGCCGQPICCNNFLYNFPKVTVEHSKMQQLSNSTAKLSGNCRRIKCCMTYEYDFYEKELKNFPPINSTITTKDDSLKLNKIDVFKKEVTLFSITNKNYEIMKYDLFGKFIKDAKIQPPALDTNNKKASLDDDIIIDDDL